MLNLTRYVQSGCIALLVGTTCGASTATAGAWLQETGTTLAIVTVRHIRADRIINRSSELTANGRLSKVEPELYLEYGLASRLTLLSKFTRSTDKIKVLGHQFTNTDFQRLELGGRAYLFTWEGTRYVVDLIAGRTMGTQPIDPSLSTTGQFDVEVALITGTHFEEWGMSGFNETRIAYRHRPGIRPAEAHIEVTLGVNLDTDWLLLLKNQNMNSLGRTPSPFGHYRSNKAELSLVHELEPGFSIEAGALRTLAGRNVLKESGFKLAFWYRF